MIESELYYLVKSYRDAIEQAHKKNRFCKWPFNQFPEACCGQASDILARFLGEQGIYTKVVSGSDSNTTHAWLVLDDSILQKNIQRAEEATDYEEVNKMNRILEGYGYNKEINIYPYCDVQLLILREVNPSLDWIPSTLIITFQYILVKWMIFIICLILIVLMSSEMMINWIIFIG